jgi:hypothetical protein
MVEPWVHTDIYEVFEAEAWSGKYGDIYSFWYKEVSKVLVSVKVPPWMQEKYRSQKYKMNPMKDLKRFRERWLQLLLRLWGYKPVDPPPELIIALTEYFKALQVPWEKLTRRHNFINYNLVIIIGLEFLGCDEEYAKYFPMMRGEKKLAELCGIILQMFVYLGWQPTRTLLRWTAQRRKQPLRGSKGKAGRRRGKRRKQNPPGDLAQTNLQWSEDKQETTIWSTDPSSLEDFCEGLLRCETETIFQGESLPDLLLPPGTSCVQ